MKKKVLIILPFFIALIAFIFVYRYYNKTDHTTSLTVTEKRWVEENSDKEFDFEIVNDYPLYATNGNGVIFDFIKDFEEKIGIEFNKISYLKTQEPTGKSYRIKILDNDDKLTENDLFLYNDNYVIVGKRHERIIHIKDLKNLKLGVLKEDEEVVSFYLKSASNLSYTSYEDIEKLYLALNNDEIDMVVVPNIMYLDYTIEIDKYYINYYLTELKKQVVLTLSETDKELNNIIRKYYNKWKQLNYIKNYN